MRTNPSLRYSRIASSFRRRTISQTAFAPDRRSRGGVLLQTHPHSPSRGTIVVVGTARGRANPSLRHRRRQPNRPRAGSPQPRRRLIADSSSFAIPRNDRRSNSARSPYAQIPVCDTAAVSQTALAPDRGSREGVLLQTHPHSPSRGTIVVVIRHGPRTHKSQFATQPPSAKPPSRRIAAAEKASYCRLIRIRHPEERSS